eukprot:9999288-Karenia_brevis.AAC.1
MDMIVKGMHMAGLKLHEVEISDDVLEPLGVELNLKGRFTRLNDKRYWRIKLGIQRVLKMRRLDGITLEVMVGHCTSAGLVA